MPIRKIKKKMTKLREIRFKDGRCVELVREGFLGGILLLAVLKIQVHLSHC
jgi:hypothetical protein